MEFILKVDNIVNAKENVIAHQVNCMGVMGSRVAKAIRDNYHNVYEIYKGYCDSYKNRSELLGECLIVDTWINGKDGEKRIANLFGQYGYGYEGMMYTDYRALRKSFEKLRDSTDCNIAIPYKIGCGLGGGDWKTVVGIMVEVFKDTDRKIVIYAWQDDLKIVMGRDHYYFDKVNAEFIEVINGLKLDDKYYVEINEDYVD